MNPPEPSAISANRRSLSGVTLRVMNRLVSLSKPPRPSAAPTGRRSLSDATLLVVNRLRSMAKPPTPSLLSLVYLVALLGVIAAYVALRTARPLYTPFYIAALVVIVVFACLAQGSPLSFFALSLVLASIYITLALTWDFSSGLTGYVNFGLPFFFGVGAFTAGYFSWYGNRNVPFLLFAAILFGLLGGLLFSVPTLRLRGPYFSLLSLLLPFIAVDFVTTFWTQLKMPTLGYYDLPFLGATPGAELVTLSFANAVLLTAFVLMKESHFGLVMRGIRDDEDAVSSQGIRTFPYKVVAFTVASGVAGFSGATYAMVVTYAGLDGFGFTFLIFPILIVVVGGMGEITGSVFAGYVVILLYQYMFQAFTEITLVVFTAATIVLVLFLPRGIIGPVRSFLQFMRTPEGS